jgi:plastocyanin
MKWGSLSAMIPITALLACGGGDAPEPVTEETLAPPQGVYGQAPPATQGTPSVVILEPVDGETLAPPTEAALMDQLGLSFLPRQLIVRPGQPVEFVNSESLPHNVHLSFAENDSTVYIADMDPDDRREIVIEQEGAYDVTCDIHPGMRAVIYVTSSPFAAFANTDGTFVIAEVPPGSYTARVWSAAAGLGDERQVDVSSPSTELDLTLAP